MILLVFLFFAVLFGLATAGVILVWWGLFWALARLLAVSPNPWISWAMVSLLGALTMLPFAIRPTMQATDWRRVAESMLTGSAVLTSLAMFLAGSLLSTKVRFLRPPALGTGLLSAQGAVIVLLAAVAAVVLARIPGRLRHEEAVARGRSTPENDSYAAGVRAGRTEVVKAKAASDPTWNRALDALDKRSTLVFVAMEGSPAMLREIAPLAAEPDRAKALLAATRAGRLEAMAILLDAGTSPSGEPLVTAVNARRRPAIDLLLARGADPKVDANDVLAAAIDAKDVALLTVLLDQGVPAKGTGTGLPPLGYAAFHDPGPMLDLLLARGAELHAADTFGRTAVWCAGTFGNSEGMRFLAAKGADVNARSRDGLTPLLYAADKGMAGMVATLLELGADSSLRMPATFAAGGANKTALGVARWRRHAEIITLLEKSGAPE